ARHFNVFRREILALVVRIAIVVVEREQVELALLGAQTHRHAAGDALGGAALVIGALGAMRDVASHVHDLAANGCRLRGHRHLLQTSHVRGAGTPTERRPPADSGPRWRRSSESWAANNARWRDSPRTRPASTRRARRPPRPDALPCPGPDPAGRPARPASGF